MTELLNNISLINANTSNIHPWNQSKSWSVHLAEYFLRIACIILFFLSPWANFQLIQFFRNREFYKESSSKWYVIFKAVFDIILSLISIPVMFFLTFGIDFIHVNMFTCKFITYLHYTSDDILSILLTFLCIDRMLRITLGYRLRKRCSLTICIILTATFLNLNIHRVRHSEHIDGACHKVYMNIWDYNFDIYYSYIFISVTWLVILITSINIFVSVYCDRVRNRKRRQQQQQQQQQTDHGKIEENSLTINDSDRLGLIDSADIWEDTAVVVIETTTSEKQNPINEEQQDNIDLQISVSVLFTAGIFIFCNLPNFLIFIVRVVLETGYTTIGNAAVFIALFPLVIAYTINYFIFNHLTAYLFQKKST